MFKFPFLPREKKFLGLFEQSVQNMVKAARVLREMVNTWELVGGRVAEITELEHEGDTITHQIMAQVHRTFVTPFDREDIALLVHILDDVTDFIHAAADAMLIYKIDHPSQRATELVDIIVQAAAEIEQAMPRLRHHAELKQILGYCVEINRLENMADRVFRKSTPARVRGISSNLQILSAAFVAYCHGKNDGQTPIGVITMALAIYYQGIGQLGQAATVWDETAFGNLWWVIVISSLAISLGTAIGGWRVIRTLGLRVATLRPVRGFAVQTAGVAVIETASLLGIPVSTTHCISTAIMGVGATRRLSAVRWGIARNIIAAWIITFPVCGGLGYLFAWLLGQIF